MKKRLMGNLVSIRVTSQNNAEREGKNVDVHRAHARTLFIQPQKRGDSFTALRHDCYIQPQPSIYPPSSAFMVHGE